VSAELTFTDYVAGHYSVGPVKAVQLTLDNFREVKRWLEDNGSNVHYWTNESFVVGLWVFNTWHDRGDKTPVPFGWWVYQAETGSIGVASEVTLKEHYTLA
jgi:hypothetical protein